MSLPGRPNLFPKATRSQLCWNSPTVVFPLPQPLVQEAVTPLGTPNLVWVSLPGDPIFFQGHTNRGS